MDQERILTADPKHAFIDKTSGRCVSGEKVVIDGATEKAAIRLSRWAGASSTAAPNSGVPSAQTQHGIKNLMNDETQGTYMADRVQQGSRSREW